MRFFNKNRTFQIESCTIYKNSQDNIKRANRDYSIINRCRYPVLAYYCHTWIPFASAYTYNPYDIFIFHVSNVEYLWNLLDIETRHSQMLENSSNNMKLLHHWRDRIDDSIKKQ
jgi:hypothetical protein